MICGGISRKRFAPLFGNGSEISFVLLETVSKFVTLDEPGGDINTFFAGVPMSFLDNAAQGMLNLSERQTIPDFPVLQSDNSRRNFILCYILFYCTSFKVTGLIF